MLFGFVKNMIGQVSTTASCMAMFNMAHDATVAYSMEHGGKLPPADSWQKDIKPYYDRLNKKMAAEFEDAEMLKGFLPPSADGDLVCTWEGKKTGISYNSEVAGKVMTSIQNPTTTVMFSETETHGFSQSGPYKAPPTSRAPKMMYNERDWIVWYIEGNKDPFESGSSSTKSIKITPEDALPSKDGSEK